MTTRAVDDVLALMPPADDAFGEEDFLPSPPLSELAAELITRHEELAFVADWPLDVVWKREGGKGKGKNTLGKCTLTSGLARFYSGVSWVIWLAADHARAYELNSRQVEALLFHELKHCSYRTDQNTGERFPSVVGHDLEVFLREIEVYGNWRDSLKVAAQVFGRQLRLEEGLAE